MVDYKGFFKSKKGLTILALFVTLTLGIVIGTVVSDGVFSAGPQTEVATLKIQGEGNPLTLDKGVSLNEGFSRVAQTVEPAVVNISTTAVIRRRARAQSGRDPFHDFFGQDFFDKFFGDAAPREQRVSSLGSGIIVDSKGYILTNDHVVRNADKITVRVRGGETYSAKVIGTDEMSDLAVLKIDAGKQLPFAKVGDTSKMKVGDWVLAIGSPFGLEQTVTSGIVSATGRIGAVGPNGEIRAFTNMFGDYIQTDAAINPGNSGGPLVNTRGEVIGINTFISTESGGSQGVGFAIPSSVFVNSYNQLVTKGKIERGWLGVTMNVAPMTETMAEYFGVAGNDPQGIKDGDGVVVTELVNEKGDPAETGPAYKAGVRAEDVIVKFGDHEIESIYDLRSVVANTPPGETVPMVVVRHGKVLNLNVTLAERTLESKTAESESMSLDEQKEDQKPREIGLEFETLDRQTAQQMGLDKVTGVRIRDVVPGSLADDAGLAPNEVITHVNGKAVETATEFKDAITALPSGKGVVLRVIAVDPRTRQKAISFTSFVKP